MTRRRLVALVSAAVLVTVGLVVFAAGLFVMRTTAGRDKLREIALPFIRRAVHGGSIYIGHLSGNLITGVTIDSVAIRDKQGVLFLSTGRVTLAYDPRDLIDYRIYIRHAEVEHPYVHIIQHENGNWNFKEIFAQPPHALPPTPKELNTRGWGDYIVIDSTQARNGSFLLTMPWHPDDTLHGAVRDSVIKAALSNSLKPTVKTAEGFAKTWAWTGAHGLISHVRLTDPDSDKKFGQQFDVATLAVDEHDPPFAFHNVTGQVRHLGDSLWLTVPHFDLPASTGSGQGKLVWGSDLPVRYDLAIRGDSVALDDVNWVYPHLPRTGGGTVNLTIVNDPKHLDILDFKLAKMDVRSTRSHVTGDMTFGIGAPVLLVQNVDLRAEPIDFDFLRTLNGKPFPEDWEGQLTGTVRGPGGPLTHFAVADARGQFDDAHVRGAVSRFAGRGELDILDPAFTAFHHFDVDVGSLDLRTIEYLFPSFPRLHGTVSGTATLDSSWLDVRFSNAHLAHEDGPGDPSRVSGSGRVTYGEPYMIYDLALNAEPLSLTTLARSYPMLPLRGLMSGPVSVKGSTPDLTLALSLQGAAGAFSYDGRVVVDSTHGYGAHGHGDLSGIRLATLLENENIPVGPLSGHYDVEVDSIAVPGRPAAVTGSVNLSLERTAIRTTVDSVLVYPSQAHVRFADGRMLVDSLRLDTKAATVAAAGGIGLPGGRADSLHFSVAVDSLGGLRPFRSTVDTTLSGEVVLDSLSGSAALSGVATGRLDSLDVAGHLRGDNVYVNKEFGEALVGAFDLRDVTRSLMGAASVRLDTVTLASIRFDTVGASVAISDPSHARFTLGAHSETGPAAAAAGTWSRAGSAQTVTVDSLGIGIADARWQLAGPARVVRDSMGLRVDSLVLRNLDTAFVAVDGQIPDSGAVSAELRASHVPLRDLSTLAQLQDTLTGDAELAVSVTGTKAQPRITGSAAVSRVQWAGVQIDGATATGGYADRRATLAIDVERGGKQALTASGSYPLELTLFSSKLLDDTVSGSINATNADLALIEAPLSGVVRNVGGTMTAHLGVSGTTREPVFSGSLNVAADSALISPINVRMRNVAVHVAGAGTRASGTDSLHVDVNGSSVGTQPRETIALSGVIRDLWQPKKTATMSFTLGANMFHALNRGSLADLYLSTTDSLRLTGPVTGATLTGGLLVDHSAIFLPDADIARKQSVEVAADTSGRAVTQAPSSVLTAFVNNLQANVPVSVGSDVRLKSRQADVRLTGELALQKSRVPLPGTLGGTLASSSLAGLQLEGTLTTAGGKYTLPLGLVQRDFEVLAGGTVTFDGPADDPLLNISARYNVTQYHDQDLGVIVQLQGRLLPNPGIELTSNADYTIPESDLLSYLLIGKPGFDFGANPGASQVLTSFLAPTLSAVAANGLSRTFGSVFDAVQFQLGSGNQNAPSSATSQFQQLLYGASIGTETHIGSKLFMSANTGLCQFEYGAQGLGALKALGAKIEYRFDPKLSLQLGRDPPTSARFCTNDLGTTGLYPTPQNWSLSISHLWRW